MENKNLHRLNVKFYNYFLFSTYHSFNSFNVDIYIFSCYTRAYTCVTLYTYKYRRIIINTRLTQKNLQQFKKFN